MLILTRRAGERVVIGDDVLVTVMEVSGQTVRLGIAAPQGLPIYREEIWLAVKEENRAAADAAADDLPLEAPLPPAASASQMVDAAPAGQTVDGQAVEAAPVGEPGGPQRPV
jgi:carbon storage regulator